MDVENLEADPDYRLPFLVLVFLLLIAFALLSPFFLGSKIAVYPPNSSTSQPKNITYPPPHPRNNLSIDTKFIADREIDIFLNGTFCLKSKFINSCFTNDRLKEFTSLQYSAEMEYTVLMEDNQGNKTIYIINAEKEGNPNVFTTGISSVMP